MTLYQMMVGMPLLNVNLGPGVTGLSEKDPHRSTSIRQTWLLDAISAACPPAPEARPGDISEAAWDFLRQMLIADPSKRMTVEAALQHPWLKQTGVVPTEMKKKEPREVWAEKLVSSPIPSRTKEARSPPQTGQDSQEPLQVPTPSKPRSYNPSRNMAYTPPVSPEMTPERTRWPQNDFHMPEKENSADPEMSPERKMRLLMKAEIVAGKWTSPKDNLPGKSALSQNSKLTSPQRSALMKPSRKTIASQMPTRELKHLGSPRCIENMPWNQLGDLQSSAADKPAVANKGLEQLPEVPEDALSIHPTGASSVKVPFFREKVEKVRSPFPEPGDLLTTSAPASRFHPRAAVGAEKALELLTPRTAERNPQVGAPVGFGVPPMPGGVNRTAAAGAKVMHPAAAQFCVSPQHRGYQQGSPLRSRYYPAQAPQRPAQAMNAAVVTQVRPVMNPTMYAPSGGATVTLPAPWSSVGRQSPQRLAHAAYAQNQAHRRQSVPDMVPPPSNIRL